MDHGPEYQMTFTTEDVRKASHLLGKAVTDKNSIDAKFWVLATITMSESRIVRPIDHDSEA